MDLEKRLHSRTPLKMTIQLELESGCNIEGETWDVSDGGIAFSCTPFEPDQWHKGMVVYGQVQGLPGEAPKIKLSIVRIEHNHIGLVII